MLVLRITMCDCAGAVWMSKIRLFIMVRSKSRCRINSVPLKQLVELSKFRKRCWSFKDGWLILEAF